MNGSWATDKAQCCKTASLPSGERSVGAIPSQFMVRGQVREEREACHETPCSAGVPPASSPNVSLGLARCGGTPSELAAGDGCGTRDRCRSRPILRFRQTDHGLCNRDASRTVVCHTAFYRRQLRIAPKRYQHLTNPWKSGTLRPQCESSLSHGLSSPVSRSA